MKTNTRKIIGIAFILTILLVPIASAIQKSSTDSENVIFTIYSHRGRIGMSIANFGNETVNYTFIVVYGFLRPLLIKRLLPTFIFENGTVSSNSSIDKTYRVRFSFSPIVAMLEVDNRAIICVGYVLGRRAIFKTVAVMDKSFIPAIIKE